ncbi:MAG TPA: TetR/AcrR family transcriptional regulator [Reyranella sp.]|jgi:AcrR family transcriptional regulator|nr:TetR/AcrR family transcriptional regulator [Reyranella sp.]
MVQAIMQATATQPDTRSGRREQNKAENRAALLKAARSVFAEIGYNAAGVRDIVRRTDLASGTFYNYFKDKTEIFSAVIAEMSAELLERQRHGEGRSTAKTAEEFLRRHCSVYFHFVAEDPEILAFGRNNVTPIRNLINAPDLQGLTLAFRQDVADAVERGALPRVDLDYLLAAISGVVFEVSVVMTMRDPVDPAAATEFATRLLVGGLDKLPKR